MKKPIKYQLDEMSSEKFEYVFFVFCEENDLNPGHTYDMAYILHWAEKQNRLKQTLLGFDV